MAKSAKKANAKRKAVPKRSAKSKMKVAASARQYEARTLPVEVQVKPGPKGYRSACLFTFDLDAEVTWVFRQVNDPIALSMGQFEPRVGVPLLLNMLDEFAIKSTFFVPGWVAEKYMSMLEDILRRGHHVEHHGYSTSRRALSNLRKKRRRPWSKGSQRSSGLLDAGRGLIGRRFGNSAPILFRSWSATVSNIPAT